MPKVKNNITAVIVLCILFYSTHAFSTNPVHHITLKNGDRVTALILKHNEDHIVLRMTAGPEMVLEKNKILSILPVDEHVSKKNPQIQTKAQETDSKGNELKYSGRVSLGGKLQTGNSETESLVIDSVLKARDQKNRYKAEFDFNRSEEDGTVTNDTIQLGLNYDRFLNEKWFVGGVLDFEQDDVAKLDLRTRAGVKTGYQFFEEETLNLILSAGTQFIRENFANDSTQNDLAFSQGVDYEQKFFKKALTLFYEHDFLVPYGDTSAFIYEGETGLRVPLVKQFVTTAGVDIDWDNDPADGVKEEDVTYSLKIGYEF